jgi:hypothetical protein
MKKLELDALAVDTFATTAETSVVRGTVLGQELGTLRGCPVSWNGTCSITCDCTGSACP